MKIANKKNILFCIFTFLLSFIIVNFIEYLNYPSQINVIEGKRRILNIRFPFKINNLNSNKTISISNLDDKDSNQKNEIEIIPLKKGKAHLQINLFGLVPVKKLEVDVLPRLKVIPGGHSIGVKLKTRGVLIVGLEEIVGVDKQKHNPGQDAGLKIGDSILEIEGEKVKNAEHVIEIINKYKDRNINIKVKRNKHIMNFTIKPVKSILYNDYKIGLWVKDSTAGVGTLTFYEPNTKIYGALGHAISDVETGQILSVGNGEIVKSRVVSIKQGKRGHAGEIRGIFLETTEPLGKLDRNTSYGIYGKLYKEPVRTKYNRPLEIGLQNEIKLGKAKILTTTDDNKIKEYDIEIEKINRQKRMGNKSMIIRITDKELLRKTGGIVQGMSGSPIIQNGKIIGAVTHVFVNDPTKGYGIFIEWMLKESGIENYIDRELAKTG
ncbi:stage IV sporulation protein B [Caminicella sporogenes DSM 14501]|uniref:Stage IV sporulation protein B n=1 Tax=Caminicella sporogenes DSM 14501 TaxID=1121266 RepID=A0A1M6LKZ4_9FIRM|nr:SpoIVB peptidase [Caminicella sporogenes]SHJ71876.1 stage IV sporulation protein B [Caminicella sporogenes DSM 14501]